MAEAARKVLVTGSLQARPERIDELLALSLEHVRRSRCETGCLAHAVHRDVEEPLRLVFVEEWADRAALLAHFALPASRTFVKAAAACATGAPTIAVFEVDALRL
ncbi:MAG: putative quinol monooxygenase [Rubrivivax sp.]